MKFTNVIYSREKLTKFIFRSEIIFSNFLCEIYFQIEKRLKHRIRIYAEGPSQRFTNKFQFFDFIVELVRKNRQEPKILAQMKKSLMP